MDQRAKNLIDRGDNLFSKRSGVLSLWQAIADQFYVERADFTNSRNIGDDLAEHLNDSYPLFVRRELGDFLATLRRKDQEWFQGTIEREDKLDNAGKQFLERMTKIQRNAMYDRRAQFTRVMKDGDHDYVSFGQAVYTVDVTPENRLLYQVWHPRDCVWRFKADGKLQECHRIWKPTVIELCQMFKSKPGAQLHVNVTNKLDKEPYCEIECRHIVICVEEYTPDRMMSRVKYTEFYVDVENSCVMFEGPLAYQKYCIPTWRRISGTHLGSSPAVTVGLPDARLIQAMSLTVIEAGEMSVRPPMAAKMDVIPDGAKIFAGGVTGIDAEFDGRIEDAIAPLLRESRALPFGIDILKDKQQMLAQAFFLNKITLPQFTVEMTAFEFGQRLQEYIRNVIPLFEPIETEYHAAICDITNEALFAANAFGPPAEFPRSVIGHETVFKFESPLSEALERERGQNFIEAKALVVQAMELDPAAAAVVDWRKGLRDALTGKRVPATWIRSEEEVEAHAQQIQQEQEAQRAIQTVQGSSEAAQAAALAQKEIDGIEA